METPQYNLHHNSAKASLAVGEEQGPSDESIPASRSSAAAATQRPSTSTPVVRSPAEDTMIGLRGSGGSRMAVGATASSASVSAQHHYAPVSTLPSRYSHETKKNTSSFQITLQRYIMKFRILPPGAQFALGLLTLGVGLLLLCNPDSDGSAYERRYAKKNHSRRGGDAKHDTASMNAIFDGDPIPARKKRVYHFSDQYYHRNANIPSKPRVVVLQTHDISQSVLPLPDRLPPKGDHRLVGRHNPLPMPGRIKELKAVSTMDKGDCAPVAEWQVSNHPNCNVIHEASWGFTHLLSDRTPEEVGEYFDDDEWKDDTFEQIRYIASGAFRQVWMFREYDQTKMVMKTLKVNDENKNFDLRSADRHRRDAVAFEQLTKSDLVVDIYGYCTNTGIFDWGEGGNLREIFQLRPEVSKKELLAIAYNASLSLSHAHNFDERGRSTIAHTDLKPDQFLYQDGYYKLTDFNRARFLLWNDEKDEQCGFRVGKNGGIWRSPEEYDYRSETEKVDVYSLGNILYFLLTRKEPWLHTKNKEVYKRVKNEQRPSIPDEILESEDISDQYLIKAIEMAFVHRAKERPSALEIAQKLKEGLDLI